MVAFGIPSLFQAKHFGKHYAIKLLVYQVNTLCESGFNSSLFMIQYILLRPCMTFYCIQVLTTLLSNQVSFYLFQVSIGLRVFFNRPKCLQLLAGRKRRVLLCSQFIILPLYNSYALVELIPIIEVVQTLFLKLVKHCENFFSKS